MPYFTQFPVIQYSNTSVRDVSRRVAFPPSVLRQPTAFYPYTVEEGQRADTVSYLYYFQDDDDWMISLANQIVDPYYGWCMPDDVFQEYILNKYGSLEDAMQRVVHWVLNWASDDTRVTPAYYEGNLTENLKKYWVPVYGQGAQVQAYKRREEDWVVSTNMIQGFTCEAPVPFEAGELATVSDTDGTRAGTGEVTLVDGEVVTFKHVQGTWSNGYTVSTSSGEAQITSVGEPNLMIPVDERVYFSALTAYDMEYDQNQALKEVVLVQDTYRGTMYSEMKALLSSN